MIHMKVAAIKFLVISVAVFSIFGIFYFATLTNLFWISLFVTGISYLVGELFILQKLGNLKATIIDFPITFLLVWSLGNTFISNGVPILILSLLIAFLVTCPEPLIHHYLESQLSESKKEISILTQLQTEFAEESDVQTMIKNDGKVK